MENNEEGLINRERELNSLLEAVRKLDDNRGKSFIISGEAGTGKSYLIEHLKQRDELKGIDWLEGVCITREGVPFQPFKEAFKKKTDPKSTEGSKHISFSLISYKQEKGVNLFDSSKPDTIRESITTIRKMAEEKPILVVIEELHWADKSTLLAFRYISERIKDMPMILIGTYRPEESVDFDLLDDTIHHLGQREKAEKMELGPFDLEETKEKVNSIVSDTFSDHFIETLHNKTRGNPLFITETIKSLKEKYHSSPESHPENITPEDWPSTVEYVVKRKILKLDKKTRNLLQYASVLGERFEYGILSKFVRMNEMELLDCLDEAIVKGILKEVEGGREETYRFTNSAIRDVLYISQSKNKKKLLHKRAAKLITSLNIDDLGDYRFDLARHLENIDARNEAAKNYLIVGEMAYKNGDHWKAIKMFNKVKQLGKELKDFDGVWEDYANILYDFGCSLDEGHEKKIDCLKEAFDVFKRLGKDTSMNDCKNALKDLEKDNLYKEN